MQFSSSLINLLLVLLSFSVSYGQKGTQKPNYQKGLDQFYSYTFFNKGVIINCRVKFNTDLGNRNSSINGLDNSLRNYFINRDSIEKGQSAKLTKFKTENKRPTKNVLPSGQFHIDSPKHVTYRNYFIPQGNYIAFENLIINEFFYQNITEYNNIHLYFEKSIGVRLNFGRGTIKDLSIMNCKLQEISFYNCSLDTISIISTCRELNFNNCKFLKSPLLDLDSNLQRISFRNCDFSNLYDNIDLTHLLPKGEKNKCLLSLENIDLNKIKFNYSDFKIDFRYMSVEEIISMYKVLIDKFAKEGMTSSYKAATIDLKNVQAQNNYYDQFTNFIDKNWWNYGFDKSMVIRNSFLLFLGFFIANCMIGLSRLLSKGYEVEGFNLILGELNNRTRISKVFRRALYTFIYTCYVFWGLSIEKKRVRVDKIRYFFYILFQYLVGLICLAYLAAYILSK